MSTLVIVAHPDDEVLGCGGYILKKSKEEKIHLLIMSDGESSRDYAKDLILKNKIKNRKMAAEKAAKILGIKKIFFSKFRDNQMDTEPFLKLVKRIEYIISITKPKTILTHYYGDLNIDHQLVSKATITATRPTTECSVKKILMFSIPSSTEWNFADNKFKPNWYEDITNFSDSKIKALKCYNKELRKKPHPRSLDGIENLDALNGHKVGVKKAETFVLLRYFD